jgi:hypothetical protein
VIYGISGAPVQGSLLYAAEINEACGDVFSPCLAYAVANRETIRGERGGQWNAATIVSRDGGYGLFQITYGMPGCLANWVDPLANAKYAVSAFLVPAMHYFAGAGHSGDVLADIIADAFNAGSGRVASFLSQGLKPDSATTGGDYGNDVAGCMHALLTTGQPT